MKDALRNIALSFAADQADNRGCVIRYGPWPMCCNQSGSPSIGEPKRKAGKAMERIGEEVHLNEEEATAASKPHVVRWVLGVSLVLIVIAMSLVWIIPAIF